jgi:hypothetical protein
MKDESRPVHKVEKNQLSHCDHRVRSEPINLDGNGLARMAKRSTLVSVAEPTCTTNEPWALVLDYLPLPHSHIRKEKEGRNNEGRPMNEAKVEVWEPYSRDAIFRS